VFIFAKGKKNARSIQVAPSVPDITFSRDHRYQIIMASRVSTTMKAAIMHEVGGPEVLKLLQWPVPVPKDGEVLIRVKAFGLNRSEMYTRQCVLFYSLNIKLIFVASEIFFDKAISGWLEGAQWPHRISRVVHVVAYPDRF